MVVQDEVNPYQSPGDSTDELRNGKVAPNRLYLAWTAVYVLNLPIPLLLGWIATERGGRIGMIAGAFVLFAIGTWLCASARGTGRALVVGGVALGLAQVFPIAQMLAIVAGGIAAELLDWVIYEREYPLLKNNAPGFVVTTIVGGLLMSAALGVGLAIRALYSARTSR